MAQTNYTPISLYYSTTAAAVPVNTNLASGELAINTADGLLFYKDSSNVVQKIGYKLTPTTAGGTGLTSFTANGVVYASSTSALATGSALTFDGTTFKQNAGSLWITGGRSSSYSLVFPDWLIYNASTGGGLIWDNGSEQMRLTSTGLGIGTSSPGSRLAVIGSANMAYFYDGSTSDLQFQVVSSRTVVGTTTPSSLVFKTNNTERATLDSSGNLGIGVTSPVNRLDVRSASSVIANYQQIQAFSTDTSAAIDLGGGIGLGGFYNSTQIATFGNIVGRKENGTSSNYAGYLAFGTNAQATGVVERMRIDSNGNVGIGVTPTYKLDVNGTGAIAARVTGTTNASLILNNANSYYAYIQYNTGGTANGLMFYDVTNAANRMFLDASGNLVVGATSTRGTYKLDVRSDTSIAIGSNATYFGTIGYSAGTGLISLAAESGGGINFLSGATERARFNSTGALVFAGGTTTANGIGITFPATQSASTDANTLDDYEEGTWSPVQGAGLTVTGTFASSGTYTKVGRLVTLNIRVSATTISFTSGVFVSGLPFTVYNDNPNFWGVATNNSGTVNYVVQAYPSTNISIYPAVSGTSGLYASVTYFAA